MTVSEPAANPSIVPEYSGVEPINQHETYHGEAQRGELRGHRASQKRV